ncbi:universal stress protein [Streptomyces sp. NPDC057438]|uniref:universal stress protein n=1 Tax=Streptomyces sp. NPDC057438 TaxID=3346133 RepID=UPI0036A75161
MTDLALILIGVGVWIAIGLLTAWWMARRGHRHWWWLVMGAIFGPVLAVVAGERVQQHPERLSRVEAGARGPGALRVLVGVDGSKESQAALELAVELLGPYVESLVAAEVVGYDAAEDDWDPSVTAAKSRLGTAAEGSGGRVTECDVLSGPPAQALVSHAKEQDIDLIVVGAHGRGLSRRLLGNVAQELVRQNAVPVLVAGGRPRVSRW